MPASKYIVTVVTAQADNASAFFNVTYSVTKRNSDFDVVICTTDNLNFIIVSSNGGTPYGYSSLTIHYDIKVEEYA